MTAAHATSTDAWTSRALLAWMTERFERAHMDSPRVVAEMLLSHVVGCERMHLYMEADRAASATELTTLRDLVRRALDHEPVQYLVGEAWFFARPFTVDTSTLIPRPSTETLIEAVLRWRRAQAPHQEPAAQTEAASEPDEQEDHAHHTDHADKNQNPPHHPPLRIADIGTGTGCIAISLALQIPEATIIATDIEPAALDLARRNADRHGVADRIEFRLGHLLQPLAGEHYDAICSNPPYIPDHEWNDVPRNVKDHEPHTALRGGADGLDVIRPLLERVAGHLNPGGGIFLEIAHCQRDAIIALVDRAADLGRPTVLKDHEGLWRVLLAERAEVDQPCTS